jgi:hypothetical protein
LEIAKKSKISEVYGIIYYMKESLIATFFRRLSLFVYGDRDGVSLNYLSKKSNGVFLDIYSLVESEPELSKDILNFVSESKNLYAEVVKHQPKVTAERWNAGNQLFSMLYSITCAKNPEIIVETGVANGISTNAIMRALTKINSKGSLHSFDILAQCGDAYTGSDHWHFHLLPTKKTNKYLELIVDKLPRVDIWIHDSDHGYRWQKFEYLLALKLLNKNGILISDDVDASPAWGELAKTHFRKSYVLFDSTKFVGIAFK